jgi:hypothetical protein
MQPEFHSEFYSERYYAAEDPAPEQEPPPDLSEYTYVEEPAVPTLSDIVDNARLKQPCEIDIGQLLDVLVQRDAYHNHHTPSCLAAWASLLILYAVRDLALAPTKLHSQILRYIGASPAARPPQPYALQDLVDTMEKFCANLDTVARLLALGNKVLARPNADAPRRVPSIDPARLGLRETWRLLSANDTWYVLYEFGCCMAVHTACHLDAILQVFAAETDPGPASDTQRTHTLAKITRETLDNDEAKITKLDASAVDLLVLFASFTRVLFRDTLQMHRDLCVSKITPIEPTQHALWRCEAQEKALLTRIADSFLIMNRSESFASEFYEQLCNRLEPEYFACMHLYIHQRDFMSLAIRDSTELNTDMVIQMMRLLTPGMLAMLDRNQLLDSIRPLIENTLPKEKTPIRNMLVLLITNEWFKSRHVFDGWLNLFVLHKFRSKDIMQRRFNDISPKIVEYSVYQWGVVTHQGELFIHPRIEIVIMMWRHLIVTQLKGIIYAGHRMLNLDAEQMWEMDGYQLKRHSEEQQKELELGARNQPYSCLNKIDADDFGDNYIKQQSEVLRYLVGPVPHTRPPVAPQPVPSRSPQTHVQTIASATDRRHMLHGPTAAPSRKRRRPDQPSPSVRSPSTPETASSSDECDDPVPRTLPRHTPQHNAIPCTGLSAACADDAAADDTTGSEWHSKQTRLWLTRPMQRSGLAPTVLPHTAVPAQHTRTG